MSNTSHGAESPLAIAERRLCARKTVRSLVYVGMGENNGGIIVDISESGLAVASAAPLHTDGLIPLRFQIPGDNHWLEMNGEIVWISESKKRAGIRFVDLSEDTRNRVRRWIAPEVSAVEAPTETVVAREKTWRRLEMPVIPVSQSLPSQRSTPDQVTQEHAQEPRPAPNAAPRLPLEDQSSPAQPPNQEEVNREHAQESVLAPNAAPAIPREAQGSPAQPANWDPVIQAHAKEPQLAAKAAPTLSHAGALIAAPVPLERSPRLSDGTDHRQGVQAGNGQRKAVARKRRWGVLALVVTVAAFVSFIAGWFTAGVGTRRVALGQFGKTKLETGETAKSAEPSPASSTANLPSPAVENATAQSTRSSSMTVDLPARAVSDSRTDARTIEPVPASRNTNVATPSVQTAMPQPHALAPGTARAPAASPRPQAESVPPPVSVSVTAQPKATSATGAPSVSATPPQITRAAATPGPETLPTPRPAEIPEVVKASVSVSFSPYPSMRIPVELKTQMARQGAALQIGKLLSRVEPVYPEEALLQRIEGTVVLHAVIGQDGTIQGVEPRSGPAPLVAAAANAVRQWRYTSSSVGGQPVEADEDITVTFRLLKQAGHPN